MTIAEAMGEALSHIKSKYKAMVLPAALQLQEQCQFASPEDLAPFEFFRKTFGGCAQSLLVLKTL